MRTNGRGIHIDAILAVAALLLLSTACFAATPRQELFVVTEQATLRSGPSAQAPVVAKATRGQRVVLVRATGAWLLVRQADGTECWAYQGHFAMDPPPPLLAELSPAAWGSMILVEAPETDRSARSASVTQPAVMHGLKDALDMPLPPEMLEDFLREGGIGEYARVQGQGFGGPMLVPRPAYVSTVLPVMPQAPADAENERLFGLNMAARLLRDVGKPAFGMQLQRYVTLVCGAVGRYAPRQAYAYRALVLDSTQPLCLGLPGGIIVLTTGLMKTLDNEAQLALVLARQIAHVSLGHEWAQARHARFFREGGSMDRAGVDSPLFGMALDEAMERARHIPGKAGEEQDDDTAALFMAYRAGYDPQQMPAVLRKLDAVARPHQSALTKRLAATESQLFRLPLHGGMALATQRYQANR